jgi:hypothetical protein
MQSNHYMEVETNDIIGLVSFKHWMIFIHVLFAFKKGKWFNVRNFFIDYFYLLKA